MIPYSQRIKNLQRLLTEHSSDFFIINHPTDLFYLTGKNLSSGYLVISNEAIQLFVDSRYIEACQTLPFSVILNQNLTESSPLIQMIKGSAQGKNIGFDAETTSFQEFRRLETLLEGFKLHGIDQFMKTVRMVKDASEIKALKEAATLGSEGFDLVCTLLKEGVSEREIALELEIFWLRKGGQRPSFDSIIAFGPHSSQPHYRAGPTKLKTPQIALIDIGVVLENYCSDMTRTVFVGDPDPELEKIYKIVQQAQQMAFNVCKPGVRIQDIDAAARQFIKEAGYGEFFSHSLGHGVGLDVHELPMVKNTSKETVLSPGMVITIEPGIYLKGKGGVRIEDTIIITEKGFESLTQRSTDIKIL